MLCKNQFKTKLFFDSFSIIFSFVRINLEEKFERDMNDLSDGVSSSDESTSSSSMEVKAIDKGKVTWNSLSFHFKTNFATPFQQFENVDQLITFLDFDVALEGTKENFCVPLNDKNGLKRMDTGSCLLVPSSYSMISSRDENLGNLYHLKCALNRLKKEYY